MSAREYDCLCMGIVVADHLCEPIDHVPAAGELVLTPRMDLALGGCASNVAVNLVRLGHRVSVAGTVGMDVFGRFVRDELTRCGVQCEHLAESTSRETSGTLVVNTRGEDRRFIHSIGANAEFTGRDVSEEMIRSCRILYLGGYCLYDSLTPQNVASLFSIARDAGVITVLDVVTPHSGDYRPLLEPLLPVTDLFLPNFDEARLITGLNDPLAQAEVFRAMGAKTVVITCGSDGTVLVSDSVRLRAGSYSVEFVDGTGGGDAFSAGFIHGLLGEEDATCCLRYGSAQGASCVRSIGATTGVFIAEELREYIAAHDLPINNV